FKIKLFERYLETIFLKKTCILNTYGFNLEIKVFYSSITILVENAMTYPVNLYPRGNDSEKLIALGH
ncbi:MAG: hypothetical protein ACKOUU_13420, partial [Acinetobacter tjernbergiae]